MKDIFDPLPRQFSFKKTHIAERIPVLNSRYQINTASIVQFLFSTVGCLLNLPKQTGLFTEYGLEG